MGLIDQAHKNINILKELKPEDTLVGNRFTLQKQDEYVQPENMHELENVIYFTYHQLFFSFNEYKYPPKKVYGLMEDALDNIFDNKQLQEMLKDETFKNVIDDIDDKLSIISDRNYFKSPLYPLFSGINSIHSIVYTFFKEFDTMKMVREYQKNFLHEDITDEEEEEDKEEGVKEEDVKEEDKEEDKEVEDKEVEDKDVAASNIMENVYKFYEKYNESVETDKDK